MSATRKRLIGTVTLVAAGPGDAELLTVRSVRALGNAQLVIADADVIGLAHKFAKPDAEIVAAVDAAGLPLEHAARAKAVVDAAKDGRIVVRLIVAEISLALIFGRGI